MKINWKVRLNNKLFWLSIVPAIVLVGQAICAVFGVDLEYSEAEEHLITIINAVFAILAMLGVVVDPTTEGLEDSEQARTYTIPKKRGM